MALKILLADGEPNVALLLENRLKAKGYEVLSAMDGLTALEKARKEKPDVVVIEPTLSKMNGYEICGLLKEDSRLGHIPIVMLGARPSPDGLGLLSGNETGCFVASRPAPCGECCAQRDGKADAYLARPFEPGALLAAIERLISARSAGPTARCRTIERPIGA